MGNDYAAKQKEHAAKIRAERTVMDMTGMSRSDVRQMARAGLQGFAKQMGQARQMTNVVPRNSFYPGAEGKQSKVEPAGGMLNQTGASKSSASMGGGNELPTGALGDMLYHDGSNWVIFSPASSPARDPVLRMDKTTKIPYWDVPSAC